MILICFFTCLVAFTAAFPTTTQEPPNGIRQCARSECPVYTELEDFGVGLWKRRIEPGRWLYKEAPTCNRSVATGLVYLDLHFYFMDHKISRTTPIMLETVKNKARPSFCPDQSDSPPCCDEIHRLMFFIPAVSQSTAPPPPTDVGLVLLNMTEPREFYGITFDGRPTARKVSKRYDKLVDFLEEQDIRFEDDDYLVASYDAPWRPKPHRNEILIPIKKCRRGQNDKDNENDTLGDGFGDGRCDGGMKERRRKRRSSGGHLSDIDLIPFGI